MKLTWYGTASILVETETSSVLFDPFIPMRGSEVPTKAEDFDGRCNIVITHAHYDHVASLSALVEREERSIYGTNGTVKALRRHGVAVNQIGIGDELVFGDIKVTAYRGKHVRIDAKLLRKTVFNKRTFRYCYNLVPLIVGMLRFRERGETVSYLVEAEGKRVLLFGSMGIADTDYPKDVDLFVLPYQGRSDLLASALPILDRIKPKKVFLNHFDDSFPPFSCTIDTRDVERAVFAYKPNYGEPFYL